MNPFELHPNPAGATYNHDDPTHVYRRRRNPSGCAKFYCLRRFRRWWYRWFTISDWLHRPFGGWR